MSNWIKMRTDLAEQPEVVAMAVELNVEEDLIIGKLHHLWSWVDRQTTDGNVTGVTGVTLDRVTNMQGFASALVNVGWLLEERNGLTLPGWKEWNSQSSKQRSLNAQRQARYRERKSNVTAVTGVTPPSLSISSSKKKKRGQRKVLNPDDIDLPEEIATPEFREWWAKWVKHRNEKKAPLTRTNAETLIAEFRDWGIERSIAAIRYTIRQGWQGIREPEQQGGDRGAAQPHDTEAFNRRNAK